MGFRQRAVFHFFDRGAGSDNDAGMGTYGPTSNIFF